MKMNIFLLKRKKEYEEEQFKKEYHLSAVCL